MILIKFNNIGAQMLNSIYHMTLKLLFKSWVAQWLSGRVLDSRPKGRRVEPHLRHCIVS